MVNEDIRKLVRENYGKIAVESTSCCNQASSCCSGGTAESISRLIGYSDEELATVPKGANLGLGCGNPVALASIKEGETVLDLGSGAGFDCFLAAEKVGKSGKVIGVDMTPEMIEKARENAGAWKLSNVEFRLGEIENLPVADNTVDIIISNCVINLSPEKKSVFEEAFRVLRPGGRIMVSDIVLEKELPEVIRNSIEAYVGCISGAILKNDYLNVINNAGFEKVDVLEETIFPIELISSDEVAMKIIDQLNLTAEDIKDTADSILSVKISAVKPD